MDKVGGASDPLTPHRNRSASPKGKKTTTSESVGFLGFLTRSPAKEESAVTGPLVSSGEVSGSSVESLLDDVYAMGQELAQNPSPEHVLSYKKAVARFIRVIVDGSVDVIETEGRLRKDMKKPKYAVLHVIDEKLDKLGAYVLQNQRDKLEILRRVDELHGLLIDLKK